MKFYSRQYCNIRVWGNGAVMQFKDSVYETANDNEIKELLRMGFDHDDGAIQEAPIELKKHVIPQSWNTEKIKQYAGDSGIIIPHNILLRRDIIQYIENS